MEEEPVTVDELIWAAEELKKTKRLSTAQHDMLISERLHALMRTSRSRVRALIDDRIMVKMPYSAAAAPATLNTAQPPTAKELQHVGLTLSAITKSDANFTSKALVFAGVLRSFEDAQALGVKNWKDFIDQVGRPSDVCKWLKKATREKTSWTQGFLGQKSFTFNDWLECRYHLKPVDLVTLEFLLGTHLNARPALWKRTRENATQWLTIASQEEWIQHNQLTLEQYSLVLTPTTEPTMSPPTPPTARNPGFIVAQKNKQQQLRSNSGRLTDDDEEEVTTIESLPPVKSGMLVHFSD
jgi:hypothetical protein